MKTNRNKNISLNETAAKLKIYIKYFNYIAYIVIYIHICHC